MDQLPRQAESTKITGYVCRPVKPYQHVWLDIHRNATDIEWYKKRTENK